MHSVSTILHTYLPVLIQAGEYARTIQDHVASQPDKTLPDATLISAALTDADLSIQNLFEVVTLAAFPEVSFIPEEIDTSINVKYFPQQAETCIFLDPVNGTRFYKDKSGVYDIILTIFRGGRIIGGVTYLPEKERFYLADEQQAYITTKSDVLYGSAWHPFQLPATSPSIIMTYRADSDEVIALRRHFDEVKQLDADYDPAGINYSIHDILTGQISAYYRRNAPIIDWGIIGYIAQKAGGCLIDFAGAPLTTGFAAPEYRARSLLCARTPAIAQVLRNQLKPD